MQGVGKKRVGIFSAYATYSSKIKLNPQVVPNAKQTIGRYIRFGICGKIRKRWCFIGEIGHTCRNFGITAKAIKGIAGDNIMVKKRWNLLEVTGDEECFPFLATDVLGQVMN